MCVYILYGRVSIILRLIWRYKCIPVDCWFFKLKVRNSVRSSRRRQRMVNVIMMIMIYLFINTICYVCFDWFSCCLQLLLNFCGSFPSMNVVLVWTAFYKVQNNYLNYCFLSNLLNLLKPHIYTNNCTNVYFSPRKIFRLVFTFCF